MGMKGNGHDESHGRSWSPDILRTAQNQVESLRLVQAQLEVIQQAGEGWMKQLETALAVLSESLRTVKGAVGELEQACKGSQPPQGGTA